MYNRGVDVIDVSVVWWLTLKEQSSVRRCPAAITKEAD